MINIHPEIVSVCNAIQTIISEYIQEYSDIVNWYEIQSAETLNIHQSEVDKWVREAELYKQELLLQRENILHIAQNMFAIADAGEINYAEHDKSYAKRRGTGKLKLDDSYEYPFESNSSPLDQLNYINDRLNELINLYSSKKTLYLIKEIMSIKGTKRHRAYAEMEFLINKAAVLIGLLDRSVAEVRYLHDEIDENASNIIVDIQHECDGEVRNLDLEYQSRIFDARKTFENKLHSIVPIIDLEAIDNIAVNSSVTSDRYRPLTEMRDSIFLGKFEYEISVPMDQEYVIEMLSLFYKEYVKDDTILVLPLIISASTNHLLFLENRMSSGSPIESIKGFICHYLLGMPIASVNCYFIDGYHSGADFKIYSKLNEADKNIVRNEVATSTTSINALLDIILKSSENLVQKTLSGHNSIFDFNHESQNVYERYSLLVIDNFPKGFDEEAFDKLERILIQSQKCGVTVVINYDENLFSDEYGDIHKRTEAIKQYMSCFFYASNLYFPEDGMSYTLTIDGVPNKWSELMQTYIKAVIENSSKPVLLNKLLTNDSELFARNSCNNLVIPFGMNGPNKVQNLVFGEGVSHSGILVGTTGSGKSTLLHSIILSAIAHYNPNELQIYLLDFKEGTEFALYADNPVPQIRFVSIESQQELGLSILQKLIEEISDRSNKFKAAKAKDIETYRNNTGLNMPRILVIVDEFQSLFDLNTNYKIAEKCADYMKTLIKQGRSFGINVLIATQGIARLHDISLDAGLYAQMTVRIALTCDNEDAEFMFKINPKITESFGSTKGVGAYVSNDSCTPEKFISAYMKDEERVEFLKMVGRYFSSIGVSSETIIYDGSKKVYFEELINRTNELEGIIERDSDYKVVLGESMGEVEPILIQFTPINKNHLLVVSNNQDVARHLFLTFVRCLLISKSRDSEFCTLSPFIFFLDYKIQTRKAQKQDGLSELSDFTNDIIYARSDKSTVEVLNCLNEEYLRRENDSDKFNQPIFLLVFGLQNSSKIIDTFDGDHEDNDVGEVDLFDEKGIKESAGQIFKKLLQKGSQRNIFIITWMDSYQSVGKLDYGDHEYFGNKLIGRMSGEDSEKLIDSTVGETINDEQLIYSDVNSETFKLKLYQ